MGMFDFLRKRISSSIKTVSDKIQKKKISESEFNTTFWQLEMDLIENNVAYDVVQRVKEHLSKELIGREVKRSKVEDIINRSLRDVLSSVLIECDPDDIIKDIKKHKPAKLMFVGFNGVGKTTTMAKVARWLIDKKLSVIFAASDTFRAASIEQLEKHAEALGIRMVKHQYKSDAAAVAYDAVSYAKAKDIDAVLIDTAGRSHTNKNLMEELNKIYRVIQPEFVIFVGDALTGNDAVEQAKSFNASIPISHIILAKADVDQKGGAILSVSHAIGKPILFLGVGQEYKDLEPFEKQKLLDKLFKED